MTRVLCTFEDCEFFGPYNEDYGECQREEITLDESVRDIECGCPDGDWRE